MQKKLTHAFCLNGLCFATDKYGDIYKFGLEKAVNGAGDILAEYLNSNNLAI